MPTVTVVNWNIQNYGPTKSGVHYGNRDVVRAIAKVVNDVNADIFVLLEVNTTHVATAQQVCDIMRAELREASLNPDTEWRRYVLSPNTGREFYAFFVRDTGMTRPLPIVGPLVGGNVPTILGGAGQAQPGIKGRFEGGCRFERVNLESVESRQRFLAGIAPKCS